MSYNQSSPWAPCVGVRLARESFLLWHVSVQSLELYSLQAIYVSH